MEWKNNLPPEIANDPSLAPYRDIAALAKSHIHAQKMLGMEKIPVPAQDAPPEQWDEVWNRLGRPKAPDGYQIPEQLPEGVKIEANDPVVQAWFNEAHRVGLNKQQTAATVRFYAEMAAQAANNQKAAQAQLREKVAGDFRREWGAAFDQNLGIVRSTALRFGGNDFIGYLEQTGLGNDPQLIKLLYKVGKMVTSDEVIGSGGRTGFILSPSESKTEIQKLFNDANFMKSYKDEMDMGHKAAIEKMRQLHLSAYPT